MMVLSCCLLGAVRDGQCSGYENVLRHEHRCENATGVIDVEDGCFLLLIWRPYIWFNNLDRFPVDQQWPYSPMFVLQ